MTYTLTQVEQDRLKNAIVAALSIPFIDDIEDYIWEAIFSYTKDIPLVDPLTSIRSKKLFDIVDNDNKIGWSAKAIQWHIAPEVEFELVIQRADIFKKAADLGFDDLDKNSPAELLGKALLKHWIDEKIIKDAAIQNVTDKRVCILLKSRDRKYFAYFEDDISECSPNDLSWKWTDDTKTGLQGIRKSDGFCVFRWYPNQKQFFERFVLPQNSFIFRLEPKRIPLEDIVQVLTEHLNNH